MARVFVTRALPGDALERLARPGTTSTSGGRDAAAARRAARPRVADAEGLLSLLTERIDAEVLDGCPRLRAIANYAVGSDNIDLAAAAARGIPVGVTPDVLTDATADLAIALLLAAARTLLAAERRRPRGSLAHVEPRRLARARVARRPLAIVGAGRIGRRSPSAPRASGWTSSSSAAATTLTPLLAAPTSSRSTAR